jgi:transposase
MGTAQARKPQADQFGVWKKVYRGAPTKREVRDLPWGEYRTTVIIEVYRVCCPQCGVKVEKVPQLPSKAPFSKGFEEAVGLACDGRRTFILAAA